MVKRILAGTATLILLALAVIVISVVQFDVPREQLVGKYATGASQFVTLPSGASAHVRDEGNPQGPVLVLIHGSNASLHTWEPWVAELDTTYRIISMDLPGHGLTGRVPGDDYSREGMATFLDELMSTLKVERFSVAGNSMGGGVAALYTLEHPDRVSSLILVDAAGIPVERDEDDVPLAFRVASMPVVSSVMRYVLPRSMVEEGLRKVFVDQSKVTEEMVSRYFDLALHEGNREATRIRFSAYAARNEEAFAARLGDIEVPTLVMWGDKDGLIPVSAAYEFKKRIPQAELVIFENVGHVPMEEVPEESAASVRAFLAGVEAEGTTPPETAPAE
ncbi:alpha/beta hydrolase [Parvibaculum sp.]|jgi:pimeloyl-ACP methyl ester carboxylesterase|uniref:alpha/beta fold hydrolase n=1 Tax=Parvibaculum sp. TaxID=2024848 RepID=UPI000C3CB001|nr:alpha/beta hydrolase [Parvibaculum sp.]MAU61119.1 alpha/beta hydrolase [Parvibaculum sp.]MBO6669634.1 alpha/beta hydrolase [Parvibaculum sp.]MBO6692821.1 alpha/beta hydrolase [Parvibaculum sp.]MBO6716068.1 alpha/beta hydrolase [Parvibaculum sp.]|tara:strand:- start:5345 stop:6346 length:1002 start_codon:yes stop_codon:yes gene_type:complete